MGGPSDIETGAVPDGAAPSGTGVADTTAVEGFAPPPPPPGPSVEEAATAVDTAQKGLDALPERISDGKGRFTPEANAALDRGQAAVEAARKADPGLDGPLAGDVDRSLGAIRRFCGS